MLTYLRATLLVMRITPATGWHLVNRTGLNKYRLYL